LEDFLELAYDAPFLVEAFIFEIFGKFEPDLRADQARKFAVSRANLHFGSL
jgi:hypothetical protein